MAVQAIVLKNFMLNGYTDIEGNPVINSDWRNERRYKYSILFLFYFYEKKENFTVIKYFKTDRKREKRNSYKKSKRNFVESGRKQTSHGCFK
jgi:hypothetical protein